FVGGDPHCSSPAVTTRDGYWDEVAAVILSPAKNGESGLLRFAQDDGHSRIAKPFSVDGSDIGMLAPNCGEILALHFSGRVAFGCVLADAVGDGMRRLVAV